MLNLYYFAKLREEFCKKISESQKGIPESEESNIKRSNSLKGKNRGPKSESHKKALSEAAKHRKLNSTKGRICIYNEETKKKKYVKPEELNVYLTSG